MRNRAIRSHKMDMSPRIIFKHVKHVKHFELAIRSNKCRTRAQDKSARIA